MRQWERADETLRIGEKDIRARRLERGLSLRALGERCGCSAAYVSDIEKGNRSGGNVLACVAKELGVEIAFTDWHYYQRGMIPPDLRMGDRGHVERCLAEFRERMMS